MPSCKQKIHVSEDQVFNYFSDLQNIVELYKDDYTIETLKDIGSACYGKQYLFSMLDKHSIKTRKQKVTVEITEYEPFESIAWSLDFDIEKQVNKNVTQVPTTILLHCNIMPKGNYTRVKLGVDFEMKEAWWVKTMFYIIILVMKKRICSVLKDIKQDIEQHTSSMSHV